MSRKLAIHPQQVWKYLWVNFKPSEDKSSILEIDRIAEQFIYDSSINNSVNDISDSQKSVEDIVSFSQGSEDFDSQTSTHTPNEKIILVFKMLIVPCLTHLYPSSSLIDIKFQNPEKKGSFYLESIKSSHRSERVCTLPEFPDVLKQKLRQVIKQAMKRRSSNSLLISRSRSLGTALLASRQDELDVLYSKVLSLLQTNPEYVEQVKSSLKVIINLLSKKGKKSFSEGIKSNSQPVL